MNVVNGWGLAASLNYHAPVNEHIVQSFETNRFSVLVGKHGKEPAHDEVNSEFLRIVVFDHLDSFRFGTERIKQLLKPSITDFVFEQMLGQNPSA